MIKFVQMITLVEAEFLEVLGKTSGSVLETRLILPRVAETTSVASILSIIGSCQLASINSQQNHATTST